MERNRSWIWAGDPLDLHSHRGLSSNATPIPLDAAALKYAGLSLTVSQARLLASLCVADRFVLTGCEGDLPGPYPKDVGGLKRHGVALETDYFQVSGRIWVIRIRLTRPPFDLISSTIDSPPSAPPPGDVALGLSNSSHTA